VQRLLIKGGRVLSGNISISGSKNATLPILAGSLFAKEVTLKNIPLVKDILTMVQLLNFVGLNYKISKKTNSIKIKNNKNNLNTVAPYKLVKTMRAGVLILGPLLAKYKKAKVSLPGGCAIGSRPVDIHLLVLKKLGAKIKIKGGYIYATAINGLKGCRFLFPKISVGATENAILAAFWAKGKTTLLNCAVEPEILDLISFLNKLGGKIKVKKRTIIIEGTKKINKISYSVMFDRIELGTFLIAGALIGKKLTLNRINPKIVKTEIKILKKMGVKLSIKKHSIIVSKPELIKKINIKTKPYPGFPTDLQAQIMVLMTKANGISTIQETIFENRFMHVPELKRMGAKIEIKKNLAKVKGPTLLSGAEIMATDLRASVCLVLAALTAENRSLINRIYHLDRGYYNLEKKLRNCNAKISRA
jgi:UDP-N-acetylglucosamine 1-carboxyvinyltransferase